jgi:hypothetical protein
MLGTFVGALAVRSDANVTVAPGVIENPDNELFPPIGPPHGAFLSYYWYDQAQQSHLLDIYDSGALVVDRHQSPRMLSRSSAGRSWLSSRLGGWGDLREMPGRRHRCAWDRVSQ